MERKQLFTMCGYPFSGKSTLSEAVVFRLGCFRVTVDDVMRDLGFTMEGNTSISEENWRQIHEAAYRHVDQALGVYPTVLYDSANVSLAQRRKLRDIAGKHGADSYVLYVRVPEQVARTRLVQNRLHSNRHDIADANFSWTVEHFEEPGPEENTIIYDQSIAPDTWVLQYLLKELSIK